MVVTAANQKDFLTTLYQLWNKFLPFILIVYIIKNGWALATVPQYFIACLFQQQKKPVIIQEVMTPVKIF